MQQSRNFPPLFFFIISPYWKLVIKTEWPKFFSGHPTNLLGVQQPKEIRRASLISEIYSESNAEIEKNMPGRKKPTFTSITSAFEEDGKKERK